MLKLAGFLLMSGITIQAAAAAEPAAGSVQDPVPAICLVPASVRVDSTASGLERYLTSRLILEFEAGGAPSVHVSTTPVPPDSVDRCIVVQYGTEDLHNGKYDVGFLMVVFSNGPARWSMPFGPVIYHERGAGELDEIATDVAMYSLTFYREFTASQ